MEKVTQTTAATAEESAAASEELNAQAETAMAEVAGSKRWSSAVERAGQSHVRLTPPSVGRRSPKPRGCSKLAAKQNAGSSAESQIPMSDTGTYGKFSAGLRPQGLGPL